MVEANGPRGLYALTLFEIGTVILQGLHRLKLHEQHPDAPLSPIFFNLRTWDNPKRGPLTPEVIYEGARLMYALTQERRLRFQHVAGVPNAGDPFAEAFMQANENEWTDSRLHLSKVTEADSRRIDGLVAGTYQEGDRVILIDDLVTKADSKLEAIRVLERADLVVTDVIVLIDREQGGARQLAEAGYQLHAVFTLSELLEFYLEQGKIKREKFDEVRAYLERPVE